MTDSASQPPAPQQDWRDDEIDLIDLIRYLWARKWWLIVCGLLGGLIGIYVAVTSTEVYRAELAMVPADEEGGGALSGLSQSLGGLAALGGFNLGGGGGKTDEALAVMKSRVLLERFVTDEQLLPILFHENWDADAKRWNADAAEDPPTVANAYKLIRDDLLSISEDRDSSVITVSVEWIDPALAAQWANELVARTNAAVREVDIREAEKNLAYLREELNKTSVVEIQQSIYGLIESQIKSIMLANVREGYAFRVIDPAAPPEDDDYVRPRKPLIVVLGGMLGGMFGLAMLGLMALIRAVRAEPAA